MAQAVDDAVATLSDGAPAAAEKPPKPTVPEAVRARTAKLWNETANVPDFDRAVRDKRLANQTLFPARSDITDPFRGKTPQEMRRRKDDRKVRTPIVYRENQTTVAMTVPDDHAVRWKAREMVPAMDQIGKPLGRDPMLTGFATTLRLVQERYLEEVNWQETAESCVQAAASYPLGVVKATFQRSFQDDPLTASGINSQRDEQDKVARLNLLRQKAMLGEIRDSDPEWDEMADLQMGIHGTSEISLWQGYSVEGLPLEGFRVAPWDCLETIYETPWMSHDLLLEDDEVREKYAYQVLAVDEDGNATKWTGVHPDDLANAEDLDASQSGKALKDMDRKKRSRSGLAAEAPGANSGTVKTERKFLVREVWSKRDLAVKVLIEGVPYPVKQWTPKRQPSQWYPFYILVLNPVLDQVYGISDTELMADIQARIHRKRSDEEKARWLSLPRGIGNAQLVNPNEQTKVSDIPPGTVRWINLGNAMEIQKAVSWLTYTYNPEAFNTLKDEGDLRMMAAKPEQFLGKTDADTTATAIDTANHGMAISSAFRQKRVRRWFERFYTGTAEVLLQELRKSEVISEVGEHAVWPEVYSDAQGKKFAAEFMQQAQLQASTQLGEQIAALFQGSPDPQAAQLAANDLIDQAAQPIYREACRKAFGFDEPMTREVLYRKLRCKVFISLNGQMDRNQRVSNLVNLFDALGKAAGAARMAGTPFNPLPFLRKISNLLGEDEDLDEMFDPDPNVLVQNLVASIKEAPQRLSPEAGMMLLQLAQQIAPALAQMMAAQQSQPGHAPGGAPPHGAPPHGGPPAPAGHPAPPPGAGGPPGGPAAAGVAPATPTPPGFVSPPGAPSPN